MSYHYDTDRFDPDVVQQLGRIDLVAEFLAAGIRHGLHRSKRLGFSTEFSDFKPYAPGDDLRLLDWRVYARTERLFIRCFEAETNLEAMLLLDASRSMAWRWQNAVTKLEYGANLLAALGCVHLRQQDRIGLVLHDADTLTYLPPRCKRSQLRHMYAALEKCRPGTSGTFGELVRTFTDTRRHRGAAILCSDLEEDQDEVMEALADLAATGDDVILFHILDAAEENLPFEQATHLRDSETGALMPVNLTTFRNEYRHSVQAFRGRWQQHCETHGILYAPVHTSMSYVDAFFHVLDRRG